MDAGLLLFNPQGRWTRLRAETGKMGRHTKLTRQEADDVRELHYKGKSLETLATMFGVCKTTICNILNNKTKGYA